MVPTESEEEPNGAADRTLLLADPNGWKITNFLEAAGLPYNLIPVDITSGDQFEEEFLRISPNNKMPAIVGSEGPDGEAMSLSESGAILMYPTFC